MPTRFRKKKRCLNPENQPFVEQFVKLKREAEYRHNRHLALCYMKIVNNLCKYPIPIRNPAQALVIEGVGATIAKKFEDIFQRLNNGELDEPPKRGRGGRRLPAGKRNISDDEEAGEPNKKQKKRANSIDDFVVEDEEEEPKAHRKTEKEPSKPAPPPPPPKPVCSEDDDIYLISCYLASLKGMGSGPVSQDHINTTLDELKEQLPEVAHAHTS